jgi:hypothetical protein
MEICFQYMVGMKLYISFTTNNINTMINEFNKWGLNPNEVKWMEHPNKDELTQELCDKL